MAFAANTSLVVSVCVLVACAFLLSLLWLSLETFHRTIQLPLLETRRALLNNNMSSSSSTTGAKTISDYDDRSNTAWAYSFGAAMVPFTAFCYGHSRGATGRVVESVVRSPVGVYGLLALPFLTLAMEKSIYDTVQAWQGIDPNVRPADRGGFRVEEQVRPGTAFHAACVVYLDAAQGINKMAILVYWCTGIHSLLVLICFLSLLNTYSATLVQFDACAENDYPRPEIRHF